MNLTKHKRYRNKKYLAAARGQPCTLKFKGCDDGGPDHESTVPCHNPFSKSGGAMKSGDDDMAFGCFNCHQILDDKTQPNPYPHRGIREYRFKLGRSRTHIKLNEIGLMPYDELRLVR